MTLLDEKAMGAEPPQLSRILGSYEMILVHCMDYVCGKGKA